MKKTIEFKWEDWKIYNRTPCEVWTRVMWYHRPVDFYNPWKKSEFYSRKDYKEDKSLSENKKFNMQYS